MWKLFNKEQSLFKTTEIPQAKACKNAAFLLLPLGAIELVCFQTHVK